MSANSHRKASPHDVPITVRDYRFGRDTTRQKGHDPVAAAWFLALSSSFPRGEAMFIAAVKHFRDDAPARLQREIRAFIQQEVNHSREHLAFNKLAREAGYDTRIVDARIAALVDEALAKPPMVQLAVTMALEHFTAIIAHRFLSEPDSLTSDGIGDPELWRWHAVEEIEHKGVAFDTWLHATRNWSDRKRYLVRCLVMLRTSKRFISNRVRDSLELMAQDGLTGWRARWQLFAYLTGKPGLLRRIFPAWLSYFRPGFHPWDHDDRALIAKYDSPFQDANLAAIPAE
ncbi:metal-dependent hydrolase [Aurantiacibacter gangjinensis]|uniref:FF domain-containing protein n=1 Tax=Aurantiacibacter gangjinensis TaxID=502682 RepID=A0A0G9MN51_9SPHN|nr:metal-dependent hydrolase [Aurantiacibacter gangjinensis]APE28219.1 FF domain protein [Aurantiacibacter gangjinensis]KLE32117.1 FF domain-containing protein [Aurantiacibacter gangjinensis]